MKTAENHFIDKSSWADGEWQNEPDKIQYQDETTGLPCQIIRNSIGGFLCGYVGVSSSHPLYGKDYTEIADDILVYGGVTYSDRRQPQMTERENSYLIETQESDAVWWFGFHCGYGWDLVPMMGYFPSENHTYKNVDFVKVHNTLLGLQLNKYLLENPSG